MPTLNPQPLPPLPSDVDEIVPGVIADRRHIHEHPELGFQETETAAFVAQRLESLGVEDIRTGQMVNGNKNAATLFKQYWSFVRHPVNGWVLDEIQQAEEGEYHLTEPNVVEDQGPLDGRPTPDGASAEAGRLEQRFGARVEPRPARVDLVGDGLAQLDPELVERVDPHKHGVGERAVLVERDQRAERRGVDVVAQDRRRRPVARIGARRIVGMLARHQRRALREHVEQELAVVVLGERIARFDHADELDRHQMRALVEQLEHRVLRVGADSAPGDRGSGIIHGLAFGSDALAVRFHLELLKIARQQPEALVISENRAGLAAAGLGVAGSFALAWVLVTRTPLGRVL